MLSNNQTAVVGVGGRGAVASEVPGRIPDTIRGVVPGRVQTWYDCVAYLCLYLHNSFLRQTNTYWQEISVTTGLESSNLQGMTVH